GGVGGWGWGGGGGWTPLGTPLGPGGGLIGERDAAPGGPPGRVKFPGPMGEDRPVVAPDPASKTTLPAHQRTEFILLFIWKEPTPSAPLRKEEEAPEETPGNTTPGNTTPGTTAPGTQPPPRSS